MGAILKPSDQQGCHIWYYRVARSSVDTQKSPPAVISRVTERRSVCFLYIRITFVAYVKPSKRESRFLVWLFECSTSFSGEEIHYIRDFY